MKTKQLIERALKFNERYIYLSITRGSIESGQLCACDNCGKLITNMVTVGRHSDQKRFTIGTDCADTLCKAKCLFNNGSQTDYQLDIYSYNKAARFVTELRKGAQIFNSGFMLALTTDKGKQIDCFKNDLLKFFPEYSSQLPAAN